MRVVFSKNIISNVPVGVQIENKAFSGHIIVYENVVEVSYTETVIDETLHKRYNILIDGASDYISHDATQYSISVYGGVVE